MKRLFINDSSPHSPNEEHGVLRITGSHPGNMLITLDDVPIPNLKSVSLDIDSENFPSATLYIEPSRVEVDGEFQLLLQAIKQV